MEEVRTIAQYTDVLTQSHTVVVKFTAHWCRPCHKITPILEEMVVVYPTIKFIVVDIEKADKALVKQEAVTSIPLIKCYQGGLLQDQCTIVGFNPVALVQNVQILARNTHRVLTVEPPAVPLERDLERLVLGQPSPDTSISSEDEDVERDDVVTPQSPRQPPESVPSSEDSDSEL